MPNLNFVIGTNRRNLKSIWAPPPTGPLFPDSSNFQRSTVTKTVQLAYKGNGASDIMAIEPIFSFTGPAEAYQNVYYTIFVKKIKRLGDLP